MKGKISSPGDYVYFKSQVPLHKIHIGSRQWRYYEFGPKVMPPLICLPSIAGNADVYYKQIMALSMKGYHVVSVDIPCVWNHQEWIKAFEQFLDAIDVHHVHLYGTSLGGFLAQIFAEHRPRRVKSLILSNTYLETSTFASAMPWAPMVSWTPPFLLKRYVLTGIRDGPHEPFIADSVDFVVSQVETLSKDDLASRLSVTVDAASVGPLLLSDSNITIMDTSDYSAISQQLKVQVSEKYPGARMAFLKSGGDFPFLSRSDEVNLHLQLHLGRVGVQPRPDLVSRGILKDHDSASPEQQDDGENTDNKPKEENTRAADTQRENEPLSLPETADSQNVDSQSDTGIVNNASDELQLPIAAESLQPLS